MTLNATKNEFKRRMSQQMEKDSVEVSGVAYDTRPTVKVIENGKSVVIKSHRYVAF